ncbi:MAG: polysaccharide biosynthesis/export family protein [Bacteroidota bacterium]
MKKSYIFYFLIVVTVLTSCRSHKDLTMFRDLKDNANLYDVPEDAPEYRIKPFDNLYLSIQTLDAEVNQLFNPSAGGDGFGSSTQQMYGDRASQYINGYMVNSEGGIKIPILGQVDVAGLTLTEAQEQISQRAEEYLKEPNVKIKVLNFKVNITGEVGSPGIYYNYEGSLNILDAISMANGITDFANIEDVVVIRHNEDVTRTYNIDFSDTSIYTSEAFYLQPNDVIYIRPNKYKGLQESRTIYSLMLSTVSTIMIATSFILNNINP